jgi:hypothetical protein
MLRWFDERERELKSAANASYNIRATDPLANLDAVPNGFRVRGRASIGDHFVDWVGRIEPIGSDMFAALTPRI